MLGVWGPHLRITVLDKIRILPPGKDSVHTKWVRGGQGGELLRKGSCGHPQPGGSCSETPCPSWLLATGSSLGRRGWKFSPFTLLLGHGSEGATLLTSLISCSQHPAKSGH